MLSPFSASDKQLTLNRFPIAQVNRSLQAWDAADEYLLNYLNEQQLIKANCQVLIFNDTFGALSTQFCSPLATGASHAEEINAANVYCVNDSYISQQGIRHNIQQNQLDDSKVHYLNCLEALPKNADIILFKIPKSKSLLIEQLINISNTVSPQTVFIAADRAKDIHSSTLKLFEKHLGSTTTSLAVKKARLVFCQLDSDSKSPSQQSPFPTVWTMHNKALARDFIISNHANVYSREKLDIGGRYFIENLPKIKANSQVIDLGCGNGVVGLSVLASEPSAQVQFVDESQMAITSAEQNINTNLPELITQCQFHLNDCLTHIDSNSVDLILCNPPFHQQSATTDHIAWQMFKDSHRVLKKGGELRIIGNRQLAYHIKLKRIFGNETLIASNDKFVTQSAIKR
ncbi:23S rRNA (guanine(1835)-N(2))-methyltransferase [Colwellia sp. 39_35_sub15_T18]|nr:23S rRNA (guanine(1835)-N(2))-methyltransferase [Colwellia sp. 39_35_sub15_T18]